MKSFPAKTRKLLCLLVFSMIAVTVFSSFSLVWMRQQIGRTAERASALEERLEEKERKLRYLNERIAKIHQPVVLQSKVAGRLRPSRESQIVWVREEKRSDQWTYSPGEPYKVSMDLAFMEMESRP